MTLIIKQLTIKGEVLNEEALEPSSPISESRLEQTLEEMKKEIKEECLEKMNEALENYLMR
ncbi:DUF5908 family protein [Algoriphagus halophilus]|uniref:DUF5908 family protein n=1 Tax=Algoriphagus halophilus TaxID=226505 RepID=UPI00358EB2AF